VAASLFFARKYDLTAAALEQLIGVPPSKAA